MTATEVGDEESCDEVEGTLPDGRQVDEVFEVSAPTESGRPTLLRAPSDR